jgi:fatty acid-binding protein DegV
VDNYEAMSVAEGLTEARDDQHHIAAWQHLIDTGLAWTLQGWFGREANHMIEQGYCTIGIRMLPPEQESDPR